MKKIIIKLLIVLFFTNYSFSQDVKTVGKKTIQNNNGIELQSYLIPLSEYKELKKVKKEAITFNKDYKITTEISETSICIKADKSSNYIFPKKEIQRLNATDDFEKNQIILEPESLTSIKKNHK